MQPPSTAVLGSLHLLGGLLKSNVCLPDQTIPTNIRVVVISTIMWMSTQDRMDNPGAVPKMVSEEMSFIGRNYSTIRSIKEVAERAGTSYECLRKMFPELPVKRCKTGNFHSGRVCVL